MPGSAEDGPQCRHVLDAVDIPDGKAVGAQVIAGHPVLGKILRGLSGSGVPRSTRQVTRFISLKSSGINSGIRLIKGRSQPIIPGDCAWVDESRGVKNRAPVKAAPIILRWPAIVESSVAENETRFPICAIASPLSAGAPVALSPVESSARQRVLPPGHWDGCCWTCTSSTSRGPIRCYTA